MNLEIINANVCDDIAKITTHISSQERKDKIKELEKRNEELENAKHQFCLKLFRSTKKLYSQEAEIKHINCSSGAPRNSLIP